MTGTVSALPPFTHTPMCDTMAMGQAAQDMRAGVHAIAVSGYAAQWTAVHLLDHLAREATTNQRAGRVPNCDCRKMALKAADEELRVARKSYDAATDQVMVVQRWQRVVDAAARRDAIKAGV